MTRRFLAALLASAFLLSLAACGNTPPDDAGNAGKDSGETDPPASDTETETEDVYAAARSAYDALEKADLAEEDFVILVQQGIGNSENEVWVEESVGEGINDAVYARNLQIANDFHCVIQKSPVTSVTAAVQQSATAGDQAYDAAYPQLAEVMGLATGGKLYDFRSLPHLQLEGEWWDQATASLAIGGKVYFMEGDINYLDNDVTYILLFNKQLIRDEGLSEPYQLVRDRKWTLDVFTQMLQNTSDDVNGDGVFDTSDRYGLVTTNEGANIFFYGADVRYVYTDEEGMPVLRPDTEKITVLLDRVNTIMNRDHNTSVPGISEGKAMFMNDQVLFYGEVLSYIINLQEMETPFGVLPVPMYDEMQDGYYTYCENLASAVTIPAGCASAADSARILEAMAIQSHMLVTPAYYENALQRRYARDSESAEMLDIALENRVYDIGRIYTDMGLFGIFAECVKNDSNAFVSSYESRAKSAVRRLEKLVEKFEKLG